MEQLTVDVLVIGAGAAGLASAAAASDAGARVLVLSKEPPGTGDTKISTGLMAVPADPSTLAADMAASGGRGPTVLAGVVAEGAAAAHGWLAEGGLRDRGKLPQPMGGHSEARSVAHANKGVDVAWAASRAALRSELVSLREDAWVLQLLAGADGVGGALVWLPVEGRMVQVRAGAVVLATGGFAHLYHPHSDTMRSNTGDGHRLALEVGAELVDMAFVQFTPFGLVAPRSMVGLPLGESTLGGPRGRLLAADGALLAEGFATWSRAEVAGVMARALAEGRGTAGGGVWLDLGPNLDVPGWTEHFRASWGHVLVRIRRSHGPEAARFERPWEVAPTAHYCMGGVAISRDGATSVPGLYAAGQVAGGVHGANRLGSTSLPTAIVTGLAAGAAAAASAALREVAPSAPTTCSAAPLADLRRLQAAAWEGLGPGRTASGIRGVAALVEQLATAPRRDVVPGGWDVALMASLELDGLLACARAVAEGAGAPSRGAHLRLDEVPS